MLISANFDIRRIYLPESVTNTVTVLQCAVTYGVCVCVCVCVCVLSKIQTLSECSTVVVFAGVSLSEEFVPMCARLELVWHGGHNKWCYSFTPIETTSVAIV